MRHIMLFLMLVACAMGIAVQNNGTNVITYFAMRNKITGILDPGVTIANLEMYYIEDQVAISADVFSQAHGAVTDAHTDGECIYVGQGLYRADWPDAAFDGGIGKRVQLILVDGDAGAFTEILEVQLSPPGDTVALSSDPTAANNLEAMFDGTGYNDDNAPSTQLQVSTLAGGIAVETAATADTVTEGEATLTYAATASHDGAYFEVASDAISDDIDFYLTFNTGSGENLPVFFHLHGYYEDGNPPATNTLAIQSYDYNIAGWETIATIEDEPSDIELNLPLHVHDVDPDGGNEGDVLIRFKITTPEVSSTMFIDHATVGYVTGGLTVAAIADGVWGETMENSKTYSQVMRVIAAVLSGKTSIVSSVLTFVGIDGTTDRLAVTVSNGERTSVDIWDGD